MDNLAKLLESRTFEFQVGKTKQSFFVYASAFKGKSDRLDAFIHGVLAKRRAVLPDVNPDVFLAACAYAYTGRYEVPSPEKIYGSGHIEPIRHDSSVQRNISPQLNRGIKRSSSALADSEEDSSQGSTTTTTSEQSPARSQQTADPPEDTYFRSTPFALPARSRAKKAEDELKIKRIKPGCLLFHCWVHLFADTYSFHSLKCMATREINNCLDTLKYNKISVRELVSVLSFVFANGSNKKMVEESALRNLFIPVCVRWTKVLNKYEGFRKLLRDNGELAMAIISATGDHEVEKVD